MKKTSFAFFLILLASSFLNQNCSFQSKECKAALADLTSELAIAGSVKIFAGVKFDVPTIIKNLVATGIQCSTLSAGESEARVKIDYDEKSNGTFSQNLSNGTTYVPTIDAGKQANINYSYKFNSIGQYRLITFADDKDQVKERDEKNNGTDPNIATVKSSSNPVKNVLMITVLPNPNYTKGIKEPDVQLINRTITITPL